MRVLPTSLLCVLLLLVPESRAAQVERLDMPVYFEANEGQAASEVRFLSRASGYTLLLTDSDALVVPRGGGEPIRMRFVGSSNGTAVRGEEPLPGRSNYFIGSDPSRWCTQIPHYGRVRQVGLYHGVDVVYRGGERGIEYDLIVEPGGDLAAVRLAFDGVRLLEVEEEGNLAVVSYGGTLLHLRPTVFEEAPSGMVPRDARWQIDGKVASLHVAEHDLSHTLVIDPILSFASYLGGSSTDQARDVAVDGSGAMYVTGATGSPDFPPLGCSAMVFVTKIAPDGTIAYSTCFGGSASASGGAITTDAVGNAYVAGWAGIGFPVTPGAFQPSYAGVGDAFVAKLSASGSTLVYASYLGGSNTEDAMGIDVDTTGNAYVTGRTGSSNFPTKAAFQPTYAGGEDAFVSKVNPDGTALVYSTYLGGSSVEWGRGIAVDGAGSAHVTGWTESLDFPTANAIQANRDGQTDAFVSRLDPSGSAFVYSTYLGGSAQDWGYGIAVDGSGNTLLTGGTTSSDFPTVAAFQTKCGGSCSIASDAFVTKLDSSGAGLVFSTYLGGPQDDFGFALATDAAGNAYASGYSNLTGFPSFCAFQPTGGGSRDTFIAKYDPAGVGLYATYFGGSDAEEYYGGIDADDSGNVYVASGTYSSDIPTVGPFQATYGGGIRDAFVARITDSGCGPPGAGFTGAPLTGAAPLPVQLTAQATGTILSHQWSFGDGGTSTAMSPRHVYTAPGTYDVTQVVSGPGGTDSEQKARYVHVTWATDSFVAGPGPGLANPNLARILSLGGVVEQSFTAYGAGAYGTTVGSGDLDGILSEVLTGPGPGPALGPQVRAFRSDGTPVLKVSFYSYGTLKYGVNVASGDLDGDWYAEIVTGPGPGSVFGPHVRAFNYDGASVSAMAKVTFYAYGTLKYGVNVASPDVDGDGYAEILTGPGPSVAFGPHARGWNYDGASVAPIGAINALVFPDPQYGCHVAGGDVDGDGAAEGLFGAGPGPSLAERLRGFELQGGPMAPLPGLDVIAFPGLYYGLRPTSGDIDTDGVDEVVASEGSDPSATSRLRGYDYVSNLLLPVSGADFDAFAGLSHGVYPSAGLHGY